MEKKLSPWSLLWVSLTSMIGSGWLFGSLYSAHFAGPAAIIAWPLAAFLLLFVALSYAEVATMFPQPDSLANMPLYTHGRLTSVMMSGLTWISLATIPVIETQGLVQYASNYLPGLMIQNGVHYTTTWSGYGIALILLFSFVLLNYFGLRFFARINASFTLWKLLIPSITILAFLTMSYHAKNFSQFDGFMPYGLSGIMAAMSSGGVLFSLLGFRQVVIMMSDIERPDKYVPMILISSLAIAALIYTSLQWAFIGSLGPQDLTHGWANLSFPGDAGPFAALAGLAGMMWLSTLLYSDAFISPYSTGLVYSTTGSRMLASMSMMGDAPKTLAATNKYQVPYMSLVINFLLAMLMFFLLENWQAMSAFLVAVMMVSYTVGPISLILLRKQLPNYTRPFRLRCGMLVAFIGFYVCTAGVYWAGLSSILKLLLLLVVGLSLYLFFCKVIKKSQKSLDAKNSLWLICYLLGLGIFSYVGNYGGKGLIPLYWDLLYLLGFSGFIFILAIKLRKSNEYVQNQCMQQIRWISLEQSIS